MEPLGPVVSVTKTWDSFHLGHWTLILSSFSPGTTCSLLPNNISIPWHMLFLCTEQADRDTYYYYILLTGTHNGVVPVPQIE